MSSPHIENNDEVVNSYINYLELQDLKTSSIDARLWSLVSLFKYLKYKKADEITKQDVEAFAVYQKRSGKAKPTQRRDLINTRAFFEWLKLDNNFFVDIKIKKERMDTSQKDYVTAEDVKLLLQYCKHQRDRAFIFILWESGARLGEVLSLNVGDVKPNKYGIRITVTGKTGTRDILLIDSVPDIQLWLNQYKGKDIDPLFPLIGKPRTGRLAHGGAQTLLKRLVKDAGLERKRIYCHSFRHGRLTELSVSGLSEMMLRNYAGWTRESNMPAVYLHPEQKDTEKKLLALKGIEPEEEDTIKKVIMQAHTCPRCGKENPFDFKFCGGCSLILDQKTALEMDKEKEEIETDIMSTLLKDPELSYKLLDLLRKL